MHGSRGILETDVSPFRNLPPSEEEKAILAKLGFVRKSYPAHTDIAKQGDTPERIFFIWEGWTALYRIMSDGGRQIIDFPLPGDIVGLDGAKRGVQPSFMAVTDTTVYAISATSLIATAAQSSHLAEFLIKEGNRQKAILIEHMINLGRRGALARVAHLLLELGVRLSAIGLAQADGYACPLTQYDLADALGLTAIHVNRMLRELRQSDLLHLNKGYVGVLDQDELVALADFDPSYLSR